MQVTDKISVNIVIDFSRLHSGADLELLQTSKMECFETTVNVFYTINSLAKLSVLDVYRNPGDNHHNHR